MAAPRAASSEGLSAVEEVEGEWMVVDEGKRVCREEAMRGVWDVPPERMTWSYGISAAGRIGRRSKGDRLRQCRERQDQLSVQLLLSIV